VWWGRWGGGVQIQVQKPATDRRGGKQKLAPGSGSGFVISSDGFYCDQ